MPPPIDVAKLIREERPFGRLVILSEAERLSRGRAGQRRLVVCRCTCGATVTVLLASVWSGNTQSCGCLHREQIAGGTQFRHGHGSRRKGVSLTYESWVCMIQRCTNPKNRSYPDYGGRGITVCERWRTYENFLADMGERPTRQHSIDRYPDQDGGYEPGNCRWALPVEQGRNQRRNRMLTHDGRTMCLQAWADETGLDAQAIAKRLNRGWPLADALNPNIRGRTRRGAVAAPTDAPA